MAIILFIFILTILVFVHELGHFLAAKSGGIRVDEFGVGFPPAFYKKKVGETVYSLNIFPIGGFVKIFGENPNNDSINGQDSKRSLTNKPKLIQAWVVSAGIIFNLIFAWLLISEGFMAGLPYPAEGAQYSSRVQDVRLLVSDVLPRGPADVAGLKTGDEIIRIESEKDILENPETATTQRFILDHDKVDLTYKRDQDFTTIRIYPIGGVVEGRHAIGISMDAMGVLKFPVDEALYAGLVTTGSLTKTTIVGLYDFFKQIFTGKANFSQVSGPVGIAGVVGNASTLGLTHLLYLVALISINLAVVNLIPFPALDGGRLLFIIIETVKRSPIKPAVANMLNGIGFILLILLMIVVTYHDITKLFH